MIFGMATKSSTKTKKETAVTPKTETVTPKSEKTKHSKPILAVLGAIILLFIFMYAFKGLFVAASVNGEKISRFAVISALEKQAGKQTLESMITKSLILQEAKKRNITVSQQDIDAEIGKISKNVEAQGTTLDQALAAQGMTRNQLNDEIRIQLFIQKMVADSAKVTEAEINDFITTNKDQFPEGTTEADMRKQAEAAIKQQSIQTATQTLISNLQKNAKTIYFVKY